jgi:hypothetical protein
MNILSYHLLDWFSNILENLINIELIQKQILALWNLSVRVTEYFVIFENIVYILGFNTSLI